ncbi:potassium channel family protein [Chloroflexota bacterium]
MYIIVVGGGGVGYYLTRELLNEDHEVLVLERDAATCEAINDDFGSVCVRGDGCEVATLAEVGTSRADMLIAVTGHDEDNLVVCQVAKQKFNVPRTIARIRNPRNETIFRRLGIDVTVNSTDIILEHIAEEVPTHALTRLLTLRHKGLEIVQVKIPSASAIIGKSIKELSLPEGSVLSLIIPKEQKPFVPNRNTVLKAGDQVLAITAPELEEALRSTLMGM